MTLLLTIVAMLVLSLSMARHQRDLFLRPFPQKRSRALRRLGFAMLAVALSVAYSQGAIGVVRWMGELSVAVLLIGMMMALGGRLAK